MTNESRAITVANDQTLTDMIGGARQRLAILAPAVSLKVALAVAERWAELGGDRVTVILDVDPEVYRLGYGESEALTLLEKTGQRMGTMLQRQPGIRTGLVIADEKTLIYSPTPLLIEASPKNPTESQQTVKPNAILLDSAPPKVEQELGQGENGVRDQTVGLDKAKVADIKRVEDDLQQNPPQKFDIARTVRVFNAKFEFVEFALRGCTLSRRTVPIPSDLMGLAKDPKTQKLLHSQFSLVDEADGVSGERVNRLKQWIADRYLISLPRYGNVILRSNKQDFESAVKALRRYVNRFRRNVEAHLQEAMDSNRKALVQALAPAVLASPPRRWIKILGRQPTDRQVQDMLEAELDETFGTAKSVIKEMEVHLVFKGVTYESLCDPEFIKIAREAIPTMDALHTEFEAAKGEAARSDSPENRSQG